MVANGITGGPLGLAVFIILYSIICLSLSTLLCYMLWKHDSRTTYVFFISLFTSLSSAASIVQQIYFAASFYTIKEREFQARLNEHKMSEVIINSGAQGLDKGLFWIQFYSYNVNAILVLFWAIQLFKGTWNLRVGESSGWSVHISNASKVVAVIFPAFLLAIANAPSIRAHPLSFLILCNLMLAISLIAGSVILALTLFKFVQARRKLNSLSDSGLSRAHANRSTAGRDETGAVDTAEARRRRDDRWMVTRFSIAFVVLGIFELCIILFQYSSYNSYISTATPVIELGSAAQMTSIAQFIPGVTASLVAFLVWGTTSTFRAEISRILAGAGTTRRGSRLVNEERGAKPDYFERLSTRGKEEGISVTTELTIVNAGMKEIRIMQWEESDEDAGDCIKQLSGRSDGVGFITSTVGTGRIG